jgi:cellulose synthase (UDP-forming)
LIIIQQKSNKYKPTNTEKMTKIQPVIHLPQAPTDTEKYSYILKRPLILKVLYAISLISWLGVLYGYFNFFNNSILYYAFISPIVIYLTICNFVSIGLNFGYKKFNIERHESIRAKFWKENNERFNIDVFLPVCGEGLDILRNTWEGVKTLKNPLYDINPAVLDDMDHPGVRQLAAEFGFNYVVRPNRGHMKKAGNLKYAFDQTNGDFIIIFDADFKPRADFILDTVPYMADQKVGIIQTPQFFDQHYDLHNHSPLQAGAGNIQEYFYKIIQVARNTFGGAICVGSCALYRRKALEEVGGTAQVEHSEDVHTGFTLINKGWKLKYFPIVLSKGVCPDDMHAFFKQQTRWCQGSMSMMVNSEFWQSKVSINTKLCFISGFLFYISNPLTLLLTFQTFLLLAFHTSQLGSFTVNLFIPLIINSFLIQYYYIYPKVKSGTILAHCSTVWFYSFTLLGLVFGHTEGWKPSGTKSSLSRGFLGIARFTTSYLVLYLSFVLVLTYFNKLDFTNSLLYPSAFWITINTIYHTHFWLNIQDYVKNNHSSRIGFLRLRKATSKFVVFALIAGIFVSASTQFIGNQSKKVAQASGLTTESSMNSSSVGITSESSASSQSRSSSSENSESTQAVLLTRNIDLQSSISSIDLPINESSIVSENLTAIDEIKTENN